MTITRNCLIHSFSMPLRLKSEHYQGKSRVLGSEMGTFRCMHLKTLNAEISSIYWPLRSDSLCLKRQSPLAYRLCKLLPEEDFLKNIHTSPHGFQVYKAVRSKQKPIVDVLFLFWQKIYSWKELKDLRHIWQEL